MEPPRDYTDMILIPSILHIPPKAFGEYPPAYQQKIRRLLYQHVMGGWAGNTDMVPRTKANEHG